MVSVPVIITLTKSCAMLWARAPRIHTPIIPKIFLPYFITKYITKQEKRPPERLMAPAVAPLVMKTKDALIKVIIKPCESPKESRAKRVMIFESPGLAPGGRKVKVGKRPSIEFSANA